VRTVRTECLDWILVWNPRHLRQVLTVYLGHCNQARPHRGLDLHVPIPAPTMTASPGPVRPGGRIERADVLGGLIHEYRRVA